MRIQIGREINRELASRFNIKQEGFILKSGKIRVSYRNIPLDVDGWADCNSFLPINYDLVVMKTTEGKEKNGWWAEKKWCGLRLKKIERISRWKFISRKDD